MLSAVPTGSDPDDPPPRAQRSTVLSAALLGALVPWLAWPLLFGAVFLQFALLWVLGAWAIPIVIAAGVAAVVGLWFVVLRTARRTGAHRPRLVTVIALAGLAGSVVAAVADGSPWQGAPWLPVGAVMSAASAVGCCIAVLLVRPRHSWIPFALLGAALLLLGLLSPAYQELQAENEVHGVIDAHGQEFAVLDDGWRPVGVAERHDTLRITYENSVGDTVFLGSWDDDRRFNQNTPYTLRHSCDYEQMTCTDQGDLLVRDNDGVVDDVRLTLDDGTIVSVQADYDADVDLVAVAEQVRQATPEDREALVEAVT